MSTLNLLADAFRMVLPGLLVALGVGDVQAALGQAHSTLPAASTSIAVPSAKMLANRTNGSVSLYVLHEVQLENGTLVREYATPAGIVFAVTWQGPVLPDLRLLLGGYFSTFKAETDQARLVGRRGSSVHVDRDGLVIVSSGRMRNFFGHAYAPDLIPAGVNIQDVLP